jgi:hypothetical protein
MNGTIPRGRYAGIPIRAHWTVLVILPLLTVLLAQDIPVCGIGSSPC